MRTVLITGMSGTGKSTVITDLASLGYAAADLDTEMYSMWIDAEPDPVHSDNEVKPGKDWVWNPERVLALLASQQADMLFVSGCSSNMVDFYPRFTDIILLTASDPVLKARLTERGADAYGSTKEELERVLRLKITIEPLLREDADLEIDTGEEDNPAALILRYVNSASGISVKKR